MDRHRLLAIVIAVATVAFAIGVSIESSDAHPESGEVHVEGTAEGEAAEHSEAEAAGAESEADHGEDETLLGIDVESTPLVVAAVLVSLAVAAGVWLRPELESLLGLVVVVMLLFAALDLREVLHQADESETGLAILAAVVALLHLSAAALAFQLTRTPRSDRAFAP